MANSFYHRYVQFVDRDMSDKHARLWGFVIRESGAKMESETLQILYFDVIYLTAVVRHLKISSIKKTSHAYLGEELVHKSHV
jgi:hypothetical protein